MDHRGNMSTSSSLTSSTTATSSSSTGGVRKQILTLKPKQPNGYVQHLEIKAKESSQSSVISGGVPVPVTLLELKKKDRSEKNVVTNLKYRKPTANHHLDSVHSSSEHHHHHHLSLSSLTRRPGSPSSSGYETDSLVDQENCDVFSSLFNSSLSYQSALDHHHQFHELDMLHSHPIWSPQLPNNNTSLMMGSNSYYLQ